jgi:hypothetical protein
VVALDGATLVHGYQNNAGPNTASIMRSTNGGVGWANVYDDPTYTQVIDIWSTAGSVYALLASPVIGGAGNGGRIIRSVDGGATWAIWFDDPLNIMGPGGTAGNVFPQRLVIAGGHE